MYTNIINAKDFDASKVTSSKIKIPIYDVYFALLDNNVIDISHFTDPNAGETEKLVKERFEERKAETFEQLRTELIDTKTPYEKLSLEYQVYESYIAELLYNNGILMRDVVDTSDETYIAWTLDEIISLNEYLNYCISQNWIDVSKLNLSKQYSESEEIYLKIVDYIFEQLDNDLAYTKKVYKYMLKGDIINGTQICKLLLEQDIIDIDEEEEQRF